MLDMREQIPVSDPIRVFYGFDPRLSIGSYVFLHSMHRRASAPVEAQPIMLSQLEHEYWRERDGTSTDFAFARFLVPYLCGYKGWALFVGGADMMCRDDIAELWALRDYRYAVQVVKHDGTSTPRNRRFPTAPNARSRWSSVMLFNCEKCRVLTPKYVNEAGREQLHQLQWLDDGRLIGELPEEWNHLTDVSPPDPNAKLVHWTNGSPFLNQYRSAEFADEWFEELHSMTHVEQSPGLKTEIA